MESTSVRRPWGFDELNRAMSLVVFWPLWLRLAQGFDLAALGVCVLSLKEDFYRNQPVANLSVLGPLNGIIREIE